jgi:DNA-binding beta-propeller fold protein YncE/predicted Ser/Thr protein kinase
MGVQPLPGDEMANRIGSEIAGYRIESLIARGGMGEVYLATQSFPERKVALKLLPHDLAADPAFRERFIRESNATASLEHPNIVPVYGAGESDGELWIAMRFVEGQDLRSLLDGEGPLAPRRAASICAQIADALEEAHEHGLVHRDVKPGNILVSKGDRTYLSDFGLIRPVELDTSLTKTGQFMGTVDYVAPEQIKGEAVDGRADVYSLGCVLTECLTGEPPFRRETEVATLYAHLEDPPPVPSAKVTTVPPALDEVVARAMAKLPDSRYPTASELGIAIRAAAEPRVGATTKRFPERRRRWTAAIAAVAVVVAVGIVALMAQDDGSTRVPPDAAAPPLNSVVEVDPKSGKVLAIAPDIGTGRTYLGNRFPTLATGEGGVWFLQRTTLWKIDPETQDVEFQIPVGAPPPATFDVGFRTVWVGSGGLCGSERIERFNPSTSDTLGSIPLKGQCADALAVGGNDVWVGLQDGNLLRLEGATGHIEERIPLEGDDIDAMAASTDAVWIADKINSVLLHVDAETGEIEKRIHLTGTPDVIAADVDAAWVLDRFAQTVTRVDASTNEPGQPTPVGRGPTDLAVGLGSVWVTDHEGRIYVIDPGVRRVVDRYELGVPLASIAVDPVGGALWVSVTTAGS